MTREKPKKVFSSTEILAASRFFLKQAQTFSYDPDPMRKELDRTITQPVTNIVAKTLNTRAVSEVEVRLNYVGATKTANFVIYSSGSDSSAVDVELADELNKTPAQKKASQIMAKYLKDKDLDYKYLTLQA